MVLLAVENRRLFRALLAVAHIEQVRADDLSAARDRLVSFCSGTPPRLIDVPRPSNE